MKNKGIMVWNGMSKLKQLQIFKIVLKKKKKKNISSSCLLRQDFFFYSTITKINKKKC